MADTEQGGTQTPDTAETNAPDYHKAAQAGAHLDPAVTGGTNFQPDLSVGAGKPAVQSGAIPGGDYARHSKMRDEFRRKQIAAQAEAAAAGKDPSVLSRGGLAVTFETDDAGNVKEGSVQVEGVGGAAPVAPTTTAGQDASGAAAQGGQVTAPATDAGGHPSTAGTPTTADSAGERGGTR